MFPLAHLDWMRAAADAGRFEAIRKAMHLLHEPSKARRPFWHIGAQQTFWVRTKDWPDIRKGFISHLLEQFAHGRPSFTDLWMLSVLDEATLGVFSEHLPSDMNLFLDLLPSPISNTPSTPTWYEELRNLANLHAPLEKAQALWKLSAGIRFP